MTSLLTPASYTVDPWDPSYGIAVGDDIDGRESSARLDLDVEMPAAQWRAVRPETSAALPSAVLFLDGVRRIDARVWVHGTEAQPTPGIVASLAAGLVRCDGAASVVGMQLDRSLYTAAANATDLKTRHATYRHRPTRPGLDELSLGVQRRLSEVEVELAGAWRRQSSLVDDDLLVCDGPLHGRTNLVRTVGYVKTHQTSYLPEEQMRVVAGLGSGERSPVFTMGTSWQRRSWYLRLPGASRSPWSAIVRLECSADLAADESVALADLTARVLPPLASAPHKDPRAPQNLVPIGGLERQLRHRLGDVNVLYRSLRSTLRD
jgi:hypothetical protein